MLEDLEIETLEFILQFDLYNDDRFYDENNITEICQMLDRLYEAPTLNTLQAIEKLNIKCVTLQNWKMTTFYGDCETTFKEKIEGRIATITVLNACSATDII